ncbi:MAG: MFS transporter [Bacteroidia bacterium]
MNTTLRVRLSAMMFLNYFIWGAWYVTIGTYMDKALSFSGVQIGSVYATNAIAALISPFFVGMIADRFFPSQRVLTVLHLLGALFMFGATQTHDFLPFYLCILGYNLVFMPSIALTNSLSFYQMSDPQQQFPAVRMFGTIGWIVVGLAIIGPLKWDPTVYPLQLAAAVSVLMALYSLTLPHTPPRAKGEPASVRAILGLDALDLLRNKRFAAVIVASILICIPLAFYYSFTNPFLNEISFANASGRMTFGQISEALFLLIMPLAFARLGVRWMLVLGMGAWVLRYVLFGFGEVGGSEWMLWAGIILHGICYDFFFVTGQLFVDSEAPDRLKSSAQGLITLATYGIGMFIGSNVSGIVVDAYKTADGGHDWLSVWLIPAAFAAAVLIGFFVLFREKEKTQALKA